MPRTTRETSGGELKGILKLVQDDGGDGLEPILLSGFCPLCGHYCLTVSGVLSNVALPSALGVCRVYRYL